MRVDRAKQANLGFLISQVFAAYLLPNMKTKPDVHPNIENYVPGRHAARHLKSDVTPHAPET